MLARFLASAAALAVATWLVPGITADGPDMQAQALTIIGVAIIFGIVNAVVKPLFKFVATPLILVTLGLFLLIINAWLLELVAWIAGNIGLGWHVDSWGSAFIGAFIVSIVSFILNAFISKKGQDHR